MHAFLKRARSSCLKTATQPARWNNAILPRFNCFTSQFSRAASTAEPLTEISPELMAQIVQDKQALHTLLAKTPIEVQSAFAAEILSSKAETAESVMNHLNDHQVHALCIATFAKHFDADFHAEFAKADADHSGFINRSEFKRYLVGMAQEASGGEVIAPPTSKQLAIFALNTAIPMVVFGFLDNSIMIIGGDVVDDMIGSTFQLSTLACAALANTFADVFGISIGNSVEALTVKIGVPQANLTAQQSTLPIIKRISFLAAGMGIMIGCLMGMLPLLFIDPDLKAVREVFDRLDETNSGSISVEELQHALQSLGMDGLELSAIQHALHAVDGNHDGQIDFEEFRRLYRLFRRGHV